MQLTEQDKSRAAVHPFCGLGEADALEAGPHR